MNVILALICSVLVSLTAFSSAFLISLKKERLKQVLFVLISFAIGVLLGNIIFHLIPESYVDFKNKKILFLLVAGGLLFFLLIERVLHFYLSHKKEQQNVKSYGYFIISLGAIHSFTDGMIIMLAWLADSHAGIAASIAIALHELPHVIARFGVLLKAGFEKKEALFYNFYASSAIVLGALFTFWLGDKLEGFSMYSLPFIIGGFIYLICFALLPELARTINKRNFLISLFFLLLGVFLIYLIHLYTTHIGHLH